LQFFDLPEQSAENSSKAAAYSCFTSSPPLRFPLESCTVIRVALGISTVSYSWIQVWP